MKKSNIELKFDSVTMDKKDSIRVNILELETYDSIFVFEPYTSILKLENMFHCQFEEREVADDDSWCMVVFKLKDVYRYARISRKYDFLFLKGVYSKNELSLLLFIKENQKYRVEQKSNKNNNF